MGSFFCTSFSNFIAFRPKLWSFALILNVKQSSDCLEPCQRYTGGVGVSELLSTVKDWFLLTQVISRFLSEIRS